MNTKAVGLRGAVAISVSAAVLLTVTGWPETPTNAQQMRVIASPPHVTSIPLEPASSEQSPKVRRPEISRFVSLAELGWSDGLVFEGLSGRQELFIPVASASHTNDMTLILKFVTTSAFEARRVVEIKIADRVVDARRLGMKDAGTIEVPVQSNDIKDGFVKIVISYSGAITEQRCVDQRVSGAYLRIEPESGLALALDRNAVTLANLPRATDILWTNALDPKQSAAAFTLAADNAFVRFIEAPASGDQWQRTTVKFAGKQAPAISLSGQAIPFLEIGGADPTKGARVFNSQVRSLINGTGNPSPQRQETGDNRNTVGFATLGADTSIKGISERGTWTAGISATHFPPGKTLGDVELDVAVADDGGDIDPVISVTMNGLLLGSIEAVSGQRNRLKFAIPDGLVGQNNRLDVTVTRVPKSGDCIVAPQSYDAQVLPSSHFTFVDAPAPSDFHELASVFTGGVTINLQSGASQVPPTSRLLLGLLGSLTPVSATYGEVPQSGPYVHVADTPPPGTSPAVRFDQGKVLIQDRQGETILSASSIADLTIAQLIEDGGRPILWIRPGKNFAQLTQLPQDARLASGDVAFIASDGVRLAFSTTRDEIVKINYPESFSLTKFFRQYRGWIILIGWLAASAGFIWLLRKVYTAQRRED